jgi:hypothetical protein
MEDKAVFSLSELMDRWACSESTVKKMEREGTLRRLKLLPHTMYRAKEVYALEGLDLKDLKQPTVFEMRRLQAANRGLQNRVNQLEGIILQITSFATSAVADKVIQEKQA